MIGLWHEADRCYTVRATEGSSSQNGRKEHTYVPTDRH